LFFICKDFGVFLVVIVLKCTVLVACSSSDGTVNPRFDRLRYIMLNRGSVHRGKKIKRKNDDWKRG